MTKRSVTPEAELMVSETAVFVELGLGVGNSGDIVHKSFVRLVATLWKS